MSLLIVMPYNISSIIGLLSRIIRSLELLLVRVTLRKCTGPIYEAYNQEGIDTTLCEFRLVTDSIYS